MGLLQLRLCHRGVAGQHVPPVLGGQGVDLTEHIGQAAYRAVLLGGPDGILEIETAGPEQQMGDSSQYAQARYALPGFEVRRERPPCICGPNERMP
jgi:hypothetical protein